MIGKTIGPYVVTRLLGEGTFAEVLLAEHTHTEVRYALKLLRPEYANDPELLLRFQNEAKCADALQQCEHIVRVHSITKMDGRPALVMDHIDGTDLQQIIDALGGRGLTVERALSYCHDVAYALQFAHQHGICHRDIKPSNCLVNRSTQRVYVSDFGIALRSGGKRMTRVGAIMGTPAFMAPEVIRGGAAAAVPASDVYAVGVMLFELLTGSLPFDDEDDLRLTEKAVNEPVVPPSARCGALPPGVDELVVRCLAKRPQERFADGAALFTAIGELRAGLGQTAPRWVGVLVSLCDPLRPVAHRIPDGGLTIGATPDNHVVVDHPKVSARHVIIAPGSRGALTLTDQSTNGTLLHGQLLRHGSAEVEDGDLFLLGRQRSLRFLVVKS